MGAQKIVHMQRDKKFSTSVLFLIGHLFWFEFLVSTFIMHCILATGLFGMISSAYFLTSALAITVGGASRLTSGVLGDEIWV